LVDLPGYGYAQISKSKRKTFQEFIKAYFLERKQLVCTFVLIDSRLEPQKIDLECMQFLGENNIAFCVVFTKSDKLKTTKLNNNIAIYNDTMTQSLRESMPAYYVTSAIAKAGKDELLNYIETLNQEVAENF